jgi:hypothetical protein
VKGIKFEVASGSGKNKEQGNIETSGIRISKNSCKLGSSNNEQPIRGIASFLW